MIGVCVSVFTDSNFIVLVDGQISAAKKDEFTKRTNVLGQFAAGASQDKSEL